METNKRDLPGPGKNVRDFAYQYDIEMTRRNPQYDGNDDLPYEVAANLLREVDEFLRESEVRSSEELKLILAKLDTVIAISNDPDAVRLRKELLERYGGDTDAGGDGI